MVVEDMYKEEEDGVVVVDDDLVVLAAVVVLPCQATDDGTLLPILTVLVFLPPWVEKEECRAVLWDGDAKKFDTVFDPTMDHPWTAAILLLLLWLLLLVPSPMSPPPR